MKALLLFIVGCLITLNLFSQTYFQGGIYNNTVWTKANSPYIITGDVVLFPDKTLTVEPGVEILFNGFYFLEIRGTLVSVGNETDRIVYASNLTPRTMGDWKKVMLKTNQGAKASFEYCDFSDAEAANDLDCCWGGGPIYFKHCRFMNNYYALTGYNGDVIEVDACEFTNNKYCISSADKHITNSTFTGNEYGLFYTERISVSNSVFSDNKVALKGGRGIVDGCTIAYNGIAVEAFFEGFELRNNFIYSNDTGIMVSSYDGNYPPVKNNQICNNGLNVINMDDVNKDLTGNCWCTSDSTEIENKLIDGYDNIYLGLFNYDIYFDDCLTKMKSVIKVNLTGITATDAERFVKFYPNPFQNYLVAEFAAVPVSPVTLSVYNAVGQEVYRTIQENKTITLAFDDLPNGVYFCNIRTGSVVINRKIVKM